MILDPEQVIKRVSSPNNIVNKAELEREKIKYEIEIRDGKNHQGRLGSHNLSDEEKLAIGVLANTVGNELAGEMLGVSENTARHLRTAQTTLSEGQGTQRYGQDQSLKDKIAEKIEKTKLSISERAAEKLLEAMGMITTDKLSNVSAKDAAQISNQMSQVLRNMTISANSGNGNGKSSVKIILHQPREASETSFDVVEIGLNS